MLPYRCSGHKAGNSRLDTLLESLVKHTPKLRIRPKAQPLDPKVQTSQKKPLDTLAILATGGLQVVFAQECIALTWHVTYTFSLAGWCVQGEHDTELSLEE